VEKTYFVEKNRLLPRMRGYNRKHDGDDERAARKEVTMDFTDIDHAVTLAKAIIPKAFQEGPQVVQLAPWSETLSDMVEALTLPYGIGIVDSEAAHGRYVFGRID
jgi:hypothetical protein